jgi:integrase
MREDMELYRQKNTKVWTADFHVDGRRIRKSTQETNKSKAGEVAAEFLRQAQQEDEALVVRSNGPSPTLREFVETQFLPLTEANTDISEETKDYYRLGWRAIEDQDLANQRIDAIRAPHIRTLKVEGAAATYNRSLRTLRRILNIAVELDILMKVPSFSLREEQKREQLITADIETKMAAQMAKTRRKGALRIGLYIILDCGLRPKEIAGLQIPQVLFDVEDHGVIRILRSTTKSAAGVRDVPMTSRLRGILLAHIGPRTEGWLFPSPRYYGLPIQRQALTAAWRRVADAAGVDGDVDLYCARHTFGTDVMKKTKDPFLTMRLMGHADLASTERYQHPDLSGVGKLMDARNEARSTS